MSGRTWHHLQERLSDLADLGAELHEGMEQGQYRFLLALIAPMATDAGTLASGLETELRNEMAENGVQLPPLDPGDGA
ncbi:hypothetical protein ABIA32_000203 [Streptacidiphilus sp. MAP12-20]|uniref:hypothetical protein n=1 Tax=Streptacidiphilus sp. MAP12-20 TaxID=3156299 RepID=UPI003513A4EF